MVGFGVELELIPNPELGIGEATCCLAPAKLSSDLGTFSSATGFRLVKSCVLPKVRVGTGFAAAILIFALENWELPAWTKISKTVSPV